MNKKVSFAIAVLLVFISVSLLEARPLTVKDKRGTAVSLNVPVKRGVFHINYELIPALGVWDRVVGLGSNALTNDLVISTKPDVRNIPVIGDVNQMDAERVLALKADVIITWTYNNEALRFIEQKGVRVLAFYPESLGEFYDMVRLMGAVFGKEREAWNIVSQMEVIFAMIRKRAPNVQPLKRKKVLWLGSKPTVVYCRLDPKNDIVEYIGAWNPASVLPKRSAEVTLEKIVSWNPDVIFITGHAPYSDRDILANPQWRILRAVREGRVYKAPEWSTWSPRLALIALWMAAKTYPEYFRDINLYKVTDGFYRKVFGIPYSKVRPFE